MKTKDNNIDFSPFRKSIKKGLKENLPSFLTEFKSEPIQILFIGNCFQGSFLRPMLEAIKEYDEHNNPDYLRQIDVYTVKNVDSLRLFERETVEHVILNKKGLKKELIIDEDYRIKVEKYDEEGVRFHPIIASEEDYYSIKIIDLDSDELTLSNNLQNLYGSGIEQFHSIFCCFELHSCTNWRFSLVNILKHLKEGGIFIFSEITDTLSLMDGNFIPKVSDSVEDGKLKQETLEIFKTFGRNRTDYHYWKPEISFSNYTETQNFLSPFFKKPFVAIESKENELSSIKFNAEKIKEILSTPLDILENC